MDVIEQIGYNLIIKILIIKYSHMYKITIFVLFISFFLISCTQKNIYNESINNNLLEEWNWDNKNELINRTKEELENEKLNISNWMIENIENEENKFIKSELEILNEENNKKAREEKNK